MTRVDGTGDLPVPQSPKSDFWGESKLPDTPVQLCSISKLQEQRDDGTGSSEVAPARVLSSQMVRADGSRAAEKEEPRIWR